LKKLIITKKKLELRKEKNANNKMMYFGKKKSLAIPLRHWIKIEVQQKKT
jgi:hypothetical protein